MEWKEAIKLVNLWIDTDLFFDIQERQ